MNELMNLKLTPDEEENKKDLIELIEKICEDNEIFKQFLVDLVNKYIEIMDHKSSEHIFKLIKKCDEYCVNLLKRCDELDDKLDDINHHVSVQVMYDPTTEGLTIT